MNPEFVRVCPQCGSLKVERSAGGQMGELYYCPNCGWRGVAVEIPFGKSAEFSKRFIKK
ncbi:MAG: hypothetical protein WC602_01660 [archaeon]